jgi:DNA-binding NarL/FixJ family response regulator
MKILLVDDHTLFRERLRHFVAELGDGLTILEADSFAHAQALVQEHADVDIVLLRADEPGAAVAVTLAKLRDHRPSARVVVLSSSTTPSDVAFVLECGAVGYIPSTVPGQVLLGALRLVLAGGMYIPPEFLCETRRKNSAADVPATNNGRTTSGSTTRMTYLTPRQAQVFAQLASGKSNKMIARELGMAIGTVKTHVTAILKTLHATNRTQAAAAAHRRGHDTHPAIPGRVQAYGIPRDWSRLPMR